MIYFILSLIGMSLFDIDFSLVFMNNGSNEDGNSGGPDPGNNGGFGGNGNDNSGHDSDEDLFRSEGIRAVKYCKYYEYHKHINEGGEDALLSQRSGETDGDYRARLEAIKEDHDQSQARVSINAREFKKDGSRELSQYIR